MRVKVFAEMILEYEADRFDDDDRLSRAEMLAKFPYSVIVEGDYMELENLESWIKSNIGDDKVVNLYYSKIGYDFFFAEFFFSDNLTSSKVSEIVPHIYTLYHLSLTPGRAVKSDGYDKVIEYDPKDDRAIVLNKPGE